MRGVDDAALAVLALTNRLLDTGVTPLKASEFWKLFDHVERIGDLPGSDQGRIADVAEEAGLEAERLARLLDSGIGLAVRLDELYEKGISVVTVLDPEYPQRLRQRLGSAAPPVLYCAGELSILASDGIGIVGSRDVGPDGAEVARSAAHQIARKGVPLVSGGARGVDSISMDAAYEAGGNVVGVLADSLERAIGRRDTRHALLEGRVCLCTPYRPDARFTTGAAMGRNKIIYALSRTTLVVASAEGKGGTWAGATEALRKGYGSVAVWVGPGAGPGNEALVEQGGTPVEDLEDILDLPPAEPRAEPGEQETTVAGPGEQLTLALGGQSGDGSSA